MAANFVPPNSNSHWLLVAPKKPRDMGKSADIRVKNVQSQAQFQ
jgi:hypothetical protein